MAVELISKEALTQPLLWPIYVVAAIVISALIVLMCIMAFNKKVSMRKIINGLGIVGGGGIALLLIVSLVVGIFFRVPSNRFQYKVKINEEVMTLQQMKDFKKIYLPESRQGDNIYVFTSDKDLSEEDINSLLYK